MQGEFFCERVFFYLGLGFLRRLSELNINFVGGRDVQIFKFKWVVCLFDCEFRGQEGDLYILLLNLLFFFVLVVWGWSILRNY